MPEPTEQELGSLRAIAVDLTKDKSNNAAHYVSLGEQIGRIIKRLGADWK